MTDLYLCRHGRTELNAAGALRGHLDPPLDAVGLEQARNLGARLAGVGMARVISSPLMRAVETATSVALAAGLDVEIDGRLIDRDYGRFAGSDEADVVAAYGSVAAAPGIESAEAVTDRAMDVIDGIASDQRSDAVALVTHDAVIRIVLEALGLSSDPRPSTGSWSLVRLDEQGWRMIAENRFDAPDAPDGTDQTSVGGPRGR